jgi:predicted type IV restriction endonuclease
LDAQDQNLNEADTVLRITKLFEDVLGYDTLSEISRETQLKGKYVDMAIKINKVIKLLVEAKAAGVTLRDRHIEQAEAYAARNNYRFVLLTNGVVWNLYHLTFEEGIDRSRVFSVDVSKDTLDRVIECLSVLSRNSIRKGGHIKYWERQSALSAGSIGKCLFHEDVLARLRREIRRECDILIDEEDLAVALRKMLSQESREQIGPLRIARKKTHLTKKAKRVAKASPPVPSNGDEGEKTVSVAIEPVPNG